MTNLELKEAIAFAKEEVTNARIKLMRLEKQCPHDFQKKVIAQDVETGVCSICGLDGGWWCDESPQHVCDYTHVAANGSFYDEDECIYCGLPEERK